MSSFRRSSKTNMGQSKREVHVIPVGGQEPLHTATRDCWCHPVITENGLMALHNAKDLREKWERQGIHNSESPWCLIGGAKVYPISKFYMANVPDGKFCKKYTATYQYEGMTCTFEFLAPDDDDAAARLVQITKNPPTMLGEKISSVSRIIPFSEKIATWLAKERMARRDEVYRW